MHLLLWRFGAWRQHTLRLRRKKRLLLLLILLLIFGGHGGDDLAGRLLEGEDGVDERGRRRLLNLLVGTAGRPSKQNLRLLLRQQGCTQV